MTYSPQTLDEVRYADPKHVGRYIRTMEFDSESDPTAEEVKEMLYSATDYIDKRTRRAWRTCKVTNIEVEAELTREQRGLRFRTRRQNRHKVHRRSGVYANARNRWATVFLPHQDIMEWDPAEDKLEILGRRDVTDITEKEGRDEDSEFVLNEKAGILEIDLSNFSTGPLHGGPIREPHRVRVDYRFGNDESASDPDNGGDGLSESVPYDIQEACAKWVAADLIDGDSYGDIVPGGDDEISEQTTADKWKDEARELIDQYRQPKLV